MNNKTPPPPFTSTYTPGLHDLLKKINCSLVLSTYQAGKIIFISPSKEEDKLITLPRSFDRPMGVTIKNNKMAISCKDEIITFANSSQLALNYPYNKNIYDNLWIPRMTYYTGQVDIHDIAYCNDGIYAINTSFSCLCKIEESYNFIPIWKPPFINELVSEDRCHMNGLVVVDGNPKYVTTLGQTNIKQGWREDIISGGTLINIDDNKIILKNLAMPHSPRMYNNDLYLLLSASGEFVKVNIENESYEVIRKFNGFCRGLSFYNDYAFIGFSKLRKNSSTFSKLPFSETANFSGIKVIHLPTRSLVGEIFFQTSVDEIYDINVLPESIRLNILNTISKRHKYSLSIPNQTFWAKENSVNL